MLDFLLQRIAFVAENQQSITHKEPRSLCVRLCLGMSPLN